MFIYYNIFFFFFFFNDTATTEIYTLSLHDALPISSELGRPMHVVNYAQLENMWRSEEHTSELQSHVNIVCRLLLEKKKKKKAHAQHKKKKKKKNRKLEKSKIT